MRVILFSIALLLVVVYLLNQVRRPSRWVGRGYLWLMNRSHSGLTDWGLSFLQIEKHFTILDVGCGGGRTIQKLAALASEGVVYGVDYASGSVAASRAFNADLIKQGRVQIERASVSQLPFPDNHFDLVTAVETQYYWPDLPNDMREILRVLKPGGSLIVIAEYHESRHPDRLQRRAMKLLRSHLLSSAEQRTLFSNAGYTDVLVFEKTDRSYRPQA